MEREQIIKALECCTRGRKHKDDRPCLDCPYNECNLVGGTSERQVTGTCQGWLMKDALSIIKELTEQVEKDNKTIIDLYHEAETYLAQRDCLRNQVKNLTEENEAWQAQLISQEEKADKAYYDLACEVEDLRAENERLRSEVSVKRKLLDKAEVRIECVEEENNQLKVDICNAEMNLGHITEDNQAKDETITNLIATIKDIQADTVRKMQEMVYEFADDLNTIDAYIIKEMIDEIAKEMIGEGND